MKNGQTIHEWNCKCDFCKAGDTAPQNTEERLAELDAKLAGEYVGGMTEFWQRQKDFLLSDGDIVDPPLTLEELEHARDYVKDRRTDVVSYVTNPIHGGKITCYKCDGFIDERDCVPYLDHQHPNEFPKAHFHKDCFNPYEHYYGLDKPID